ncbi:TolC family protein [Sulfitobacter sp.]|uniref:TolC family protein n=1 Tax=Sulfitobacter sp. TaxID=1903071 RepID=UPI00356A5D1F
MGHSLTWSGGLCAAALALSGCMSDIGGGFDPADMVARMKTPDASQAMKPTYAEKITADSQIIQGLSLRSSVLPQGTVSDQVASAVLAANSRTAEAELRAATLRSEAASKNWLPKIGPQVSLTSLGSLAANLVVDQVLFDNGRRKGERAFAVADVEVAAVSLAQDTNKRVATALKLYTTAAEAREAAVLGQGTLKDMTHFNWVMEERVKGGVSDMSDLTILRQKLSEIRASQEAAMEREATSISELNAMSISPLDAVRGVPDIPVNTFAGEPLAVIRSEAEKTRAIAAAKVARAGQLPGLSAGGTVGEGSTLGLRVSSDQLLGFGTKASLEAIALAEETSTRKVRQSVEDSNRNLRRLERQISAKTRQAAEAATLAAQAKRNLDIFQEQYDAGQRQVMDVVGVYETYARQQQTQVVLKYDVVRLKIDMAEIQGVLADGSAI